MKFDPPLQQGTLIKRYKRFLADVTLPSGEEITIHCPNTGSMKNCCAPGANVWFSTSDNKKRKYPHTWEIVSVGRYRAGINTHLANALVREAAEKGVIKEFLEYDSIRSEVKYGEENSRIDLLLSSLDAAIPNCYVEIKNVTLLLENRQGVFPDAVTTRGTKHLRELMAVKRQGYRAVLFFCVQHSGIQCVAPADDIDPEYGDTLREAIAAGVEVIAYGASISAKEIAITKPVEFVERLQR